VLSGEEAHELGRRDADVQSRRVPSSLSSPAASVPTPSLSRLAMVSDRESPSLAPHDLADGVWPDSLAGVGFASRARAGERFSRYAWAITGRNSTVSTVTPGAGDAPAGGAVWRA
jgi:hypothetical protein